ncbi:Asparagine synthetase [glutamine-hydrolyzing] 1 [Planctomycetes bacterium Pan216]|uniref:asparagine synthase (glutamine-hydrolyzing) n=1 Tax=Kolteria novifilia TaxID=2527975 RepID=A0A518B867_9BACT|nr:Asparagine synthetase [glutamine-hydrolyzing] 1 [Planctomycetes bacterium Pan216]
MCGIAGVVELKGQQPVERSIIERMAQAIFHRGPDEDGYYIDHGMALTNRRLSIVGLADGQQPIFNEDKSVVVVFNGELFDYVERREELIKRGHTFRTSCDTEILVHLWEELGEEMFATLRGQYGIAIYDMKRRLLVLARDRVGICPLHWAKRGDRLYFGSEVKAILASGEVAPEVDPRGIDHIMTMFGIPTRRTVFKDISALLPGSFVKIQFRENDQPADISEHIYWDLDFPDQGDEYESPNLVEEFRDKFREATEIRLRADVPVVSYLSGGIDSATVASMSSKILGSPIPSFTVQIADPRFDETKAALLNAKAIGCNPTIARCDSQAIYDTYPLLVQAADSPVVDTACATLYRLAGEVRKQGYKVALTGEGADEALAGYPWFKVNRLIRLLDVGCTCPSDAIRYSVMKWINGDGSWREFKEFKRLLGGPQAQADFYMLIGQGRHFFYSREMIERLDGHLAFEDLEINRERMKRWHPLNQSLYLGYKTILPGLLINHKGDRVAMANSVETRYPFLDEKVVEFLAKVHPRWKLRGLTRDKYLLRRMGEGILPDSVVHRRKAMFRAPLADTFLLDPPSYVDELLSEESLKRTGLFDVEKVLRYRKTYRSYRIRRGTRLSLEMGLTAVMATQLWHHTYLGGGLCGLPTWDPQATRSVQPIGV